MTRGIATDHVIADKSNDGDAHVGTIEAGGAKAIITSFPEQGKHAVGVQQHDCEDQGGNANGQVASSVCYVSPKSHDPIGDAASPPGSLAR